MQPRNALKQDAGFTLVELMVALVVAGIVSIATYSSYRLQVKTSAAQDAVSQMQQNLRAGMNILIHDLRMAGYDPTESGNFTFVDGATFSNGATPTELTETVSTNATQMAFLIDLDGDGGVDKKAEDVNGDGVTDMGEVEQVAYRLNNTQLERYSTTTGAIEWQDIAENIEAIEFRYTLEDGTQTLTPTPVQLGQISAVQVSILARSEQRDAQYVNNDVYTPASGTPWDLSGDTSDGTNAPNDNYRRRLLITTIECRNMGL